MSLKARLEEFRTGMRPRIAEWRFMLKRIRQSTLAVIGICLILAFVGISILAPVLAPPHGDPFIIPQDHEIASVVGRIPQPPTTRHIFGTIDEQYDLYYACIWGTITAFRVGVLVVAVSLVIGLLIGTLAAFYGGLLDEALMRFTDIIIAFPGLILAMALVLALPNLLSVNISAVLLAFSAVIMFIFLAFKPDRRWLLVFFLILILSLISTLYVPFFLSIGLSRLDLVLIALTLVGWPGYARIIRGKFYE